MRCYHFDISKPAEKAAYGALCERLEAQGLEMFHSLGDHYHADRDGLALTLETGCLFHNQWNTAPIPGISDLGLRVFDWAQDAIFYNGVENKIIKRGYYLDQSPEMREARRNTYKCGYCDKQEPAAKGYVFCPHCLDSEYMKPADLPLTRLVSVGRDWEKDARPDLTEAERAHLMPLYLEAQLHGSTARGRARIAAKRADVAKKYAKAIEDATTERDGYTWLMDHGFDTNNVIYYTHTSTFGFGWRAKLSAEEVSAILEVISEFRWPYKLECADGRVLEAV
jgi:hypothetical protein